MTTLGTYNHDFPRLAKQSGFFFQLYRGRVNWSEIESLSIDDLVENRNFQLLELNLPNVINCNLEREYDLKILDQNFVKLFKLAQLGVDYLSYCQLYLDRCVVLLQEQLLAFQQECETLKLDNQKKNDELKKHKKKNRTQSYQCEKCEKVFISDVYLKFHDKRRHSNPNTPKSLDDSVKNCVDACQQTEHQRKYSISTQTLPPEEKVTESHENYEINKIKKEHNIKIDKLEGELEDLKIRLRKAEETLTEKTESAKSNLPPYNFPGPIYYPSMLQFIPSYLPQSQRGFYEVNPGYPVPQNNQQGKQDSINVEIVQTGTDPVTVNVSPQKETKNENESDNNKENIDPAAINSIPSKPLPLPRRIKNTNRMQFTNEKTKAEPFTENDNNADLISFNNQSIITSSTPIKETKTETPFESKESLAGVTNEKETISNESLNSEGLAPSEQKPKSFIRKIVKKNSPRLHNLSKNFKKSLTNLYDSVSSAGKESAKTKEKKRYNSKSVAVDELNSQLRELGVDPEWTGIPEKTMKQKLKALKHRRKQLSKENPMYPVVRQNIEDKILNKLKKKFSVKKPNERKETNEQESTQGSCRRETDSKDPTPKVVNVKMYDTDTDTETKASDINENSPDVLEVPLEKGLFIKDLTKESESEEEEKVFDFSVFQIGRGSVKNVTESREKEMAIEELSTDSDFNDFLGNFEKRDFPKSTLEEKREDGEGENKGLLFLNSEKEKAESQSILKGIPENQSRLQLNSKKKVFFAKDPKELIDLSPTNDDSWSLKSDWDIDAS